MNEHAQMLQSILEKGSLNSKEVKEGVVACFFTINRNFVKRRLKGASIEQVDAALNGLIKVVFDEHQIDPEKPDLHLLEKAELVLEEQTGFETEPDLLKMHKDIIQTLFTRAKL